MILAFNIPTSSDTLFLDLHALVLTYERDSSFASIFSDSLTWEIFSLFGAENFKFDGFWIGPRLLDKSAPPIYITGALKRLKDLGAIKFENGLWRANDIVIKDG